MLTAAEFAQLLKHTGKPVTWVQAKPAHASATVQAVVQSTAKAQESIVNAFGVNGVSIQVAADALPMPPEKFDSFVDPLGARHVVDTVVKHEARETGAAVHYTCYCKGK